MADNISDVFRMAGDVVPGPWSKNLRDIQIINSPRKPVPGRPGGEIIPLAPRPNGQG